MSNKKFRNKPPQVAASRPEQSKKGKQEDSSPNLHHSEGAKNRQNAPHDGPIFRPKETQSNFPKVLLQQEARQRVSARDPCCDVGDGCIHWPRLSRGGYLCPFR